MLFHIPEKLSKKKTLKKRFGYRKSDNDNNCNICEFIKRKNAGSWSGFKCLKMGIGQGSPDIRLNWVCDCFLKSKRGKNV